MLKKLVKTGLVRNWGINKRLYAVEPMIVRQQIVSDWLLFMNDQKYEVNNEGRELIRQMVDGKIFPIDSILNSLSYLTRTRLENSITGYFLRPLFGEMETIAKSGNALEQHRISNLIEKIGVADPESALDILITIRKNKGSDTNAENHCWGKQVYSHSDLLNDLPWILFQIAEYVSDDLVAHRFIDEFQELVILEDAKKLQSDSGKKPQHLLRRLLCESRNSSVFAKPAFKFAIEKLLNISAWPFVGLVCECLLNPIRVSMNWVANWTLDFARSIFIPQSDDWNRAIEVRGQIYQSLKNCNTPPAIRISLWEVLAKSHHSFFNTTSHYIVQDKDRNLYKKFLKENFVFCSEIMKTSSNIITVEEAETARSMWKIPLDGEYDDEFRRIACQCEKAYNELPASKKWKFHKFFDFDTDENDEVKRVAKIFQNATEFTTYTEFFCDAKKYLEFVRKGRDGMADNWRIANLAEVCLSWFDPATSNAFNDFVKKVLQQDSLKDSNNLAWQFVVMFYQRYLGTIKRNNGINDFVATLNESVEFTKSKTLFLWSIYGNSQPDIIGELKNEELNVILKYEDKFSDWECFWLFGVFMTLNTNRIQKILDKRLKNTKNNREEISKCMGGFIRSLDLTIRRYEWKVSQQTVEWILDKINVFDLDGRLLGLYDLEWLRDQAGFQLNMIQFQKLIRSRIKLEQQPKPYDDFEFMPHDFKVVEWVSFDAKKAEETKAFWKLCSMVLNDSFIALYWLPKYINQLDPSGQAVKDFVDKKLQPDVSVKEILHLAKLASIYPEESIAWVGIASPICKKIQSFTKKEKEHVYSVLGNEAGVITSIPDQVAKYYVDKRDTAEILFNNETDSSLKPYRKWVLERAEEDLRFEKERAEEADND